MAFSACHLRPPQPNPHLCPPFIFHQTPTQTLLCAWFTSLLTGASSSVHLALQCSCQLEPCLLQVLPDYHPLPTGGCSSVFTLTVSAPRLKREDRVELSRSGLGRTKCPVVSLSPTSSSHRQVRPVFIRQLYSCPVDPWFKDDSWLVARRSQGENSQVSWCFPKRTPYRGVVQWYKAVSSVFLTHSEVWASLSL